MTFLYTLNRGDKKTEGAKKVFFKVYDKVEMLHINKKIWFLVFSFSFWFQFIQQIEYKIAIKSF